MRSKFALHDLVTVTEPIIIEPCNTVIEKGERGKIIDIDPETNDVTVRLCAQFPDLHCQRNCIHIRADEVEQYLRRTKKPSTKIPRDWAQVSIGLCSLLVVGYLSYDIEFGKIAADRIELVKESAQETVEHAQRHANGGLSLNPACHSPTQQTANGVPQITLPIRKITLIHI